MNLVNQGESSGGPSVQPAKRRRGRPRKDPSLKHAEAVHVPPRFEGVKESLPQRADRTVGIDCMVGQAVTGVVEATFDAGYLLTIRIGNSNANLRGVVFKPGHYVPVTAENDVAPHVQMIRRNDVHFTAQSQGWSQTAALVPLKRKYEPLKTASSVSLAGLRGTVFPPSGLRTSDHAGKGVHMVEPLSLSPPDKSTPAGQLLVHCRNQVTTGGEQDDDNSFTEGTSQVGEEEKRKPVTLTEADTHTASSSQMPNIRIEDGKQALKSLGDDSGVSKQEIGNTYEPFSTESSQVTKPLFNYGTGRMTELLQVLQENIKETRMQIAEQPTSSTEAEYHEADPRNKASVP